MAVAQAEALVLKNGLSGTLTDLQQSLEELKTRIEEAVLRPKTLIPVNDPTLKAIRAVYPKLEAALTELTNILP